MADLPKRPTATYIDLDALAFNFHSSKQFIGEDVEYMAVVKADAYGHGAARCALRLEKEGVDWFGVAIPEEGVELRRAGVTRPILCLGSFWPGQESLIVEHNLTPVIFSLDTARRLSEFIVDKNVDIHVKIDTGMGRVGVRWPRAGEFAAGLREFANLSVVGVRSHFASADDPAQDEFTAGQIERFDAACRAFEQAGHSPTVFDIANSPGSIRCDGSRRGMVRLGGALYGLLSDILPESADGPELRPVMSLRSRIAHIKDVPAGEGLGYGRTFITTRASRIALVPIGYADGYPRAMSNAGQAVVNGAFAPVVGRVSMDWTLLDVTNIDAAVGDEVFLIGGDGDVCVMAADLARKLGTIAYEITCGISPRVPRVYLG
ncbi:MAG: alanine racemase [Chloracidobacterium sp.]|nr:alanine racemase [Chloracidobacterium sp.]